MNNHQPFLIWKLWLGRGHNFVTCLVPTASQSAPELAPKRDTPTLWEFRPRKKASRSPALRNDSRPIQPTTASTTVHPFSQYTHRLLLPLPSFKTNRQFFSRKQKCPPTPSPERRAVAPPSPTLCRASTPSTFTGEYVEAHNSYLPTTCFPSPRDESSSKFAVERGKLEIASASRKSIIQNRIEDHGRRT